MDTPSLEDRVAALELQSRASLIFASAIPVLFDDLKARVEVLEKSNASHLDYAQHVGEMIAALENRLDGLAFMIGFRS